MFIFKFVFVVCYFVNKMFVVVDVIDMCLYFIDCDGNIYIKFSYMEFGFFGIIDYDENNFKLFIMRVL